MKHTHITILKEDLERFKTACEINIGTSFMHTSESMSDDSIVCHVEFRDIGDMFYLGWKFQLDENGRKI